jgi:hypothetical protein
VKDTIYVPLALPYLRCRICKWDGSSTPRRCARSTFRRDIKTESATAPFPYATHVTVRSDLGRMASRLSVVNPGFADCPWHWRDSDPAANPSLRARQQRYALENSPPLRGAVSSLHRAASCGARHRRGSRSGPATTGSSECSNQAGSVACRSRQTRGAPGRSQVIRASGRNQVLYGAGRPDFVAIALAATLAAM